MYLYNLGLLESMMGYGIFNCNWVATRWQ